MAERKIIHYASEILSLLCEWEDCSKTVCEIEAFISHIIQEHLTKLTEDDLHCHWKDCEGFTENLSELRRHILLHAFHTKIKCHGRNLQIQKNMSDCNLSIHSRNIIPELPEPLICAWDGCEESYECPEYFYRHVDYHSESDEIKVNAICLWNGCNRRKFPAQHKLKEHLRSHTQEKLIACPTCGGMFASRTKFFDHIQRQLPIEETDPDNIYICEYCSRRLSSERLLRDHMRHHVNHYKCMYCDMTCPTPSALQLHVAYRHSDSKPHACMYCEYRCKSENDLRKHLETHSVVPLYKCPVEGCSYTTRSKTCYSTHYRKKHEGKHPAKYSCHLCEKLCTRGNYLTKHLISQHKFKWPSGHCRFRYRLHEDGLYRLQTVRYESLELSETMMCDENVDDPNPEISNDPQDIVNESNSVSAEHALITDNNAITNDPCTALESPEYSKNENRVHFQHVMPINGDSSTVKLIAESEKQATEQEPVLIKIVDAEDRRSDTGGSVLLIKTTKPFVCTSMYDQKRLVQIITKDSNGRVILETAEVITQSDYDG